MNKEQMVTLLVPTMNRPEYLIRLLRYYESVDFEGCICIGDSSYPEHLEKSKKEIDSLAGKLNIIYHELPDLSSSECLYKIFESVSTPYAAYVADDDFLVPDGISKCVQFLEENPDYSSAHGLGVVLELDSKGLYGKIKQCGYYRQPSIEYESAAERLNYHLNDYSVTLFSVHRTGSWKEMFRSVNLIKDTSFAGELLPCCKSVVLGKARELDFLYLVRQDHRQRYLLPDRYDWIKKPEWYPSYFEFFNELAKSLAVQDNLNIKGAQMVVDQAFNRYLDSKFNSQQPSGRWYQLSEKLPGIKRIRHLLCCDERIKCYKLSFKALMRPSSPYHSDFMPIFRILTNSSGAFSDEITEKEN